MVFNPATVKIDIESSKVRHLSSSTGGLDSIQWNKTNFSKVLCQGSRVYQNLNHECVIS